MNFVNRVSLIITPKQSMYEWIKTVAQDDAPSFEEISNESSCYLLDEPDQNVEISQLKQMLVTQYFLTIWKSELSIWDEYLDKIPENMNEETFNEWFNVCFSGLTFDIASEPLLLAPVNQI